MHEIAHFFIFLSQTLKKNSERSWETMGKYLLSKAKDLTNKILLTFLLHFRANFYSFQRTFLQKIKIFQKNDKKAHNLKTILE